MVLLMKWKLCFFRVLFMWFECVVVVGICDLLVYVLWIGVLLMNDYSYVFRLLCLVIIVCDVCVLLCMDEILRWLWMMLVFSISVLSLVLFIIVMWLIVKLWNILW